MIKEMRRTLFLLGLFFAASVNGAVTLEWVNVGDAGNAADGTGYGAVAYEYRIMKYEVTNAQYAEFLNAVAATDTNALYNTNMASNALGGINRSGISGSYSYSVKSGYENMPVVYVSHLDAQRFANWIHNGQGSGSTETGAYTVAVNGLATRDISATVWIPTENEWYKAAYYDPSASGPVADDYWLYPTRSDSAPSAAAPSGALNSANYSLANPTSGSPSGTNYLSNVGAYSNSSSYYGTYDQGGNVWEWNDAVIGSDRGLRGGSWLGAEFSLRASSRGSDVPALEFSNFGFRLASPIPEPTRGVLTLAAMCGLLLRRRRLPFAL